MRAHNDCDTIAAENSMNSRSYRIARILLVFTRESLVVAVIFVNAFSIFLDAFPGIHEQAGRALHWIDYGCLVYFIIEALVKSRCLRRFRRYWNGPWNKLDFVVVVISLPLLIGPFVQTGFETFSVVLLMRLGRLLRFTRVLKYVPNATKIFEGVGRALKASIGVLLVLFLVNVLFALGATLLFGDMPEARDYFGDPFRSMFSMFKVFTVEGWYEIPDQMQRLGVSGQYLMWMRIYFTVAVLVGGLVGLSIANAVFVDEMVADNTKFVEDEVLALRKELQQFVEEYRRNLAKSDRS